LFERTFPLNVRSERLKSSIWSCSQKCRRHEEKIAQGKALGL
jgi:hypothetical protein